MLLKYKLVRRHEGRNLLVHLFDVVRACGPLFFGQRVLFLLQGLFRGALTAPCQVRKPLSALARQFTKSAFRLWPFHGEKVLVSSPTWIGPESILVAEVRAAIVSHKRLHRP